MTSKSKILAFLFVLTLGAILLSPLISHAVNYEYSKLITIDHTKVPATLTNFPVLVSIANDNGLKNHVTNVNGYDLVFTDAVGNPLDHELERWDNDATSLRQQIVAVSARIKARVFNATRFIVSKESRSYPSFLRLEKVEGERRDDDGMVDLPRSD